MVFAHRDSYGVIVCIDVFIMCVCWLYIYLCTRYNIGSCLFIYLVVCDVNTNFDRRLHGFLTIVFTLLDICM